MKYYVVTINGENEFTTMVTENEDEAINEAIGEWNLLCDYDRKHNHIEVRAYAEDIEDENCACFDYDTVDWGGVNNGQI